MARAMATPEHKGFEWFYYTFLKHFQTFTISGFVLIPIHGSIHALQILRITRVLCSTLKSGVPKMWGGGSAGELCLPSSSAAYTWMAGCPCGVALGRVACRPVGHWAYLIKPSHLSLHGQVESPQLLCVWNLFLTTRSHRSYFGGTTRQVPTQSGDRSCYKKLLTARL